MGTLLIKAGRVYDGAADRALQHAYIIVDRDTIAAVGSQTELEGSTGRFEREIDLGPEVTILPGLINMHTHMSFSSGTEVFLDHQRESYETRLIRAVENLQAALRTGVTTVRDCGTVNGIAFAVRQAVEHGIMLGPRVIASGAGITTTGGHLWFCGIEADGEVEVRKAVRAQVKAGVDFLKVFATGGGTTPGTNSLAAQYTEAEMCAITEEARRLDKRVAAHVHGTPGVRTSIAAQVTTIEHCSFMQPAGMTYEPDLGRRIADTGIYVCPTIFQGRGKVLLCDENRASPEAQAFRAQREAHFRMVRQMVEQGIQLVSGSDAGVTSNAFTDYPGDLSLTVEGTDLSPQYVIQSATSVAAEALGRTDVGLVAPGKAADLLAVEGNPLQDIRTLLYPRLVVSRGRVVT
ncbi:Imidazolonepropionase [Candidatus Entotheonellaceae bacterium PAL068K]